MREAFDTLQSESTVKTNLPVGESSGESSMLMVQHGSGLLLPLHLSALDELERPTYEARP